MFGIFNTKKRIASHVGIMVNNSLRSCFAGNIDIIDENGKFYPPYGFWSDHYVVGFVTFLVNLFLKYDFNGDSFSTTKKGEVFLLSLIEICKDDLKEVKKIYFDNVGNESDLFAKGADESLVFYSAMSGRLKTDSTNPIVVKAKLLAKKRHKHYIENAKILGLSSSNYSSTCSAIAELTLVSHIKENYYNKDTSIENEQRTKLDLALFSLEIENKLKDDDQYCIEASSAIIKEIIKKAKIDLNEVHDDNIICIGLFSCIIGNHITYIMECDFNILAPIIVIASVSNLYPELDGKEKMNLMSKTIPSLYFDPIITLYNDLTSASINKDPNGEVSMAIGQNFANWVAKPSDINFKKLVDLHELCREMLS